MDEASARRWLGVTAVATRAEIEAAFRSRVMTTHPDRGGESGAFRSVVEARRALLSPPGPRRPPPVTVVPDANLLRQVVVALLRRVADRQGPRRRVL